jgi:hypothetical protein
VVQVAVEEAVGEVMVPTLLVKGALAEMAAPVVLMVALELLAQVALQVAMLELVVEFLIPLTAVAVEEAEAEAHKVETLLVV